MKNDNFEIELTKEKQALARWLFLEYTKRANNIIKRFGVGRNELILQIDYFVSTWDHGTPYLFSEFNKWFLAGFIGDCDKFQNKKEKAETDTTENDRLQYWGASDDDNDEECLLALVQEMKKEPARPSLLKRNGMSWFDFFRAFSEITLNYWNVAEKLNATKEEMRELNDFLNNEFAECLRNEYSELATGKKEKFNLSRQGQARKRSNEQILATIVKRIKAHQKGTNRPCPIPLLLNQMGCRNHERNEMVLNAIEYGLENGILFEQETKKGTPGLNYYRG